MADWLALCGNTKNEVTATRVCVCVCVPPGCLRSRTRKPLLFPAHAWVLMDEGGVVGVEQGLTIIKRPHYQSIFRS